jgi:hypothetical protein
MPAREAIDGQPVEKGMEKSAEAVVIRRGQTSRDGSLATADQGPNLSIQGSIGSTRWTNKGSKEKAG